MGLTLMRPAVPKMLPRTAGMLSRGCILRCTMRWPDTGGRPARDLADRPAVRWTGLRLAQHHAHRTTLNAHAPSRQRTADFSGKTFGTGNPDIERRYRPCVPSREVSRSGPLCDHERLATALAVTCQNVPPGPFGLISPSSRGRGSATTLRMRRRTSAQCCRLLAPAQLGWLLILSSMVQLRPGRAGGWLHRRTEWLAAGHGLLIRPAREAGGLVGGERRRPPHQGGGQR